MTLDIRLREGRTGIESALSPLRLAPKANLLVPVPR
jgi:hypothetical protein